MNKDNNQNEMDRMKKDYFNIEVPQDIDGYIESAIRRAKISRRNRYRAPIAVIAICAIIMVCLSFVKPPLEGSQNPNAFIGLNEAKHEQLPVVGSFDNLNKLLATTVATVDSNSKGTGAMQYKSPVGAEKQSNGSLGMTDTLKAESVDYSTTNVQVQGVDEGDVVKTDGKYIYKLNAYKVVIASAYPAEEMKVISEIPFDLNKCCPMEIFLNGKYMVVIADSADTIESKNYFRTFQSTKAIIFDVSDKSKPKQIRDITLEGSYISSRMVDSKLYLAANKYIPMNKPLNEVDCKSYLPRYKDSVGNNEQKTIDYNKIQYCPEAIEPNYIMVASLDLKKIDKEVRVTSILGSARNMYVSDKNLYVSGTKYDKGTEETSIYKFTLKDGAIEFAAKGNVPGYVLNQFSMDENNKYFRITTTNGTGMLKVGSGEQKNNLYVLDENLKIKGKLEGLAKGERIYSTRFIGERAYMVTFKNTDPLFVIDLKNPETPKVLGELKIPGFSNYLHPYDENHIIGFGKDTEEVISKDQNGNQVAAWAKTKGMKLAIFDVTDVNNPKQQFATTIGGRGTNSDILYDHKALLFNKDKNLLAFPVDVMKEGDGEKQFPYGGFEFQGLYVYNINLKDGFVLKGKISHVDFVDNNYDYVMKEKQVMAGDYKVQRALYINDVLYTLSNGGIKANNLFDLKEIGKIKINNK